MGRRNLQLRWQKNSCRDLGEYAKKLVWVLRMLPPASSKCMVNLSSDRLYFSLIALVGCYLKGYVYLERFLREGVVDQAADSRNVAKQTWGQILGIFNLWYFIFWSTTASRKKLEHSFTGFCRWRERVPRDPSSQTWFQMAARIQCRVLSDLRTVCHEILCWDSEWRLCGTHLGLIEFNF